MTLSDEDKKRIEAEERHRAEVRKSLEAKKGMGCGSGCLWLVVIFIGFVFVARSGNSPENYARRQVRPAPNTIATQATEALEAVKRDTAWQYLDFEDDMGRGTVQQASIRSINLVNFKFPYAGEQRGTLALRKHPKYGNDVILRVEKGQFLCGVNGCNVAIRIDSQKPRNFAAMGPADYSTTSLFIRNAYASLIKSLKTAKTVYIEAPFYQEAPTVFQFNVEGFDWPALQTAKK